MKVLLRRHATRNRGFTMIEVLIAVTITVVIIFTVGSVTRSLTQGAERQKAASRSAQRWNSFVQILKRDLRGALPVATSQTNKEQPPTPGDGRKLIALTSTADSFNGMITGGSKQERARACAQIQYRLQKTGENYQLTRVEENPGSSAGEIVLLESKTPIVVEFQKGDKWLPAWFDKSVPIAIRISQDDHFVFMTSPAASLNQVIRENTSMVAH